MKVIFEPAGFNNGWMLEDDKVSILGRKQTVKQVIPLSAITKYESNLFYPLSGAGQICFWYMKDGKEKYGILNYKKDQTLLAEVAAVYIKENYGDGIGKVVWRERRMRCRVCGKVYCYTKDDLDRNAQNAKNAAVSSAISGLAAIGGTRMDMYGQAAKAENSLNKIVDYSRCPNCNSTDVVELTEEQYQTALNEQSQAKVIPPISGADEIKKYKDLLDSGIITQEEFETKKKQLLGL